jgi:hypothetical protein
MLDWTHPDLGGGFGPGFKIVGGFDFVGDNYTGTSGTHTITVLGLNSVNAGANTPVPDPNPLDQCNGHGTHVTVYFVPYSRVTMWRLTYIIRELLELTLAMRSTSAVLHLTHLFRCTESLAARAIPLTTVSLSILLCRRVSIFSRVSVIVDALLRGVQDGQDILTMSLGGADGWTEGTASVVSSRISDTGKIVTIAAGSYEIFS